MSARSFNQLQLKTHAYETFRGLDSSRDVTALDTGRDQHLTALINASCDWRGQIARDAPASHMHGALPVHHVIFASEEVAVYADADGDGVHLRSSSGHVLPGAYDPGAPISATVFGRNVHLTSRGSLMRYYDGTRFQTNPSASMSILRPSFLASVQRRLCVAGIPGFETEVHISRVDDAGVFPGDDDPTSENVLRAGIIDVANLLGTADKITGLAPYEQNRLAIFTGDRCLVYELDPDIDKWQIDRAANIREGCISHNTIQPAGTDLLFCSRRGVHTIRRSEQNGIFVGSITLSDKVDLLYQQLLASVEDTTHVSAVYDQDRAQYHIFFPQPGGRLCKRLTLTINPELTDRSGPQPTFSTGDFLQARCGAFLNGALVFGTPGGVFAIHPEDFDGGDATPDAEIVTPLLWHGSVQDEKLTHSIILQAHGRGVIEMEATDLHGRTLGSMRFEIDEDSDDTDHTSVPLSRQYERQWERRYLAAQYRFRIVESRGLVRLIGFAIKTRKPT